MSKNLLTLTLIMVMTISTLLLSGCPKPSAEGPTANFGANPTAGYAPLSVQFYDSSVAGTSIIQTYQWDFGDGATSTAHDPLHVYTAPGVYTISFTVSTEVGSDTLTKQNFITAVENPGEGEGEEEGATEGEAEGETLEMTFTRSVAASYTPGEILSIEATIDYSGTKEITALALSETVPEGWTYLDVTQGDDNVKPGDRPEVGATGTLAFVWFNFDDMNFPYHFTYRIQVPQTASGTQNISGIAAYRTDGSEVRSNIASSTLLP